MRKYFCNESGQQQNKYRKKKYRKPNVERCASSPIRFSYYVFFFFGDLSGIVGNCFVFLFDIMPRLAFSSGLCLCLVDFFFFFNSSFGLCCQTFHISSAAKCSTVIRRKNNNHNKYFLLIIYLFIKPKLRTTNICFCESVKLF